MKRFTEYITESSPQEFDVSSRPSGFNQKKEARAGQTGRFWRDDESGMAKGKKFVYAGSPSSSFRYDSIWDDIIELEGKGKKLLDKNGYKSFDAFAGGSFHEYWEDVFFVKGKRGKYPISEAGFKKAGKAVDKNFNKAFKLSRDF